MMRKLIPIAAALALAVPVHAEQHKSASAMSQTAKPQAMKDAISHTRRDNDRARDQFRHPAETLDFFKVEPGMSVVDFFPGRGWYTRLLAPLLGKGGKYIALNPDPGENERMAAYFGGFREKFPAKAAEWNLDGAKIEAYNSNELTDAMNGTVDRVLIIRSMHNLHRFGFLHTEMNRLHALLKDDGMLGIVQHRAKPWGGAVYSTGERGYMRQKDVVGLVEAHGFELVATSEINANPKDTTDHEKGVWEMPPALRTKREDLKLLGESDRMTLLFRKRS